jgi:selenocysteine-specific elongation factor
VAGAWIVADDLYAVAAGAASDMLRAFHRSHPLEPGAPVADVRRCVSAALEESMNPLDPGVAEALVDRLTDDGALVRSATTMRLPNHHVALDARADDVARLLQAVAADSGATPPPVGELIEMGFPRELIGAAIRAGVVVGLTPDIVMSPETVERAAEFVRRHGDDGVTVSEMRTALGTTRKYAVPLAEHLDRTGVTRRDGDRRYPA